MSLILLNWIVKRISPTFCTFDPVCIKLVSNDSTALLALIILDQKNISILSSDLTYPAHLYIKVFE